MWCLGAFNSLSKMTILIKLFLPTGNRPPEVYFLLFLCFLSVPNHHPVHCCHVCYTVISVFYTAPNYLLQMASPALNTALKAVPTVKKRQPWT
jgi:hypothetical protein